MYTSECLIGDLGTPECMRTRANVVLPLTITKNCQTKHTLFRINIEMFFIFASKKLGSRACGWLSLVHHIHQTLVTPAGHPHALKLWPDVMIRGHARAPSAWVHIYAYTAAAHSQLEVGICVSKVQNTRTDKSTRTYTHLITSYRAIRVANGYAYTHANAVMMFVMSNIRWMHIAHVGTCARHNFATVHACIQCCNSKWDSEWISTRATYTVLADTHT